MVTMFTCDQRLVHVVEQEKVQVGGMQLPHAALLHPSISGATNKISGSGTRRSRIVLQHVATRIQDQNQRFIPMLPSTNPYLKRELPLIKMFGKALLCLHFRYPLTWSSIGRSQNVLTSKVRERLFVQLLWSDMGISSQIPLSEGKD